MAVITYPFGLRSILFERQKSQISKVTTDSPLSGPTYLRKLSTDAPAIYAVTFRFGACGDEAALFRAWVESNEIDRGMPFNIPMKTEFSNMGGVTIQEVQAIPQDGVDILSNSHIANGVYEYTATLRCRKEITGLEDEYEEIAEGGLDMLRGRADLDIAINISAPEYP